MNDIDIIKKHLSPEVPLILKNEDETEDKIMLKPLNTAQQALAFKISKKVDGLGDKTNIDEETMKEMYDLYKGIVSRSIPELDEETLDNFVASNFEELSKILENLMPQSKDKSKIELIRKAREDRKSG